MIAAAVDAWVQYARWDERNSLDAVVRFKEILTNKVRDAMHRNGSTVELQTTLHGPIDILEDAVKEAQIQTAHFPSNCSVTIYKNCGIVKEARGINGISHGSVLYENGAVVPPTPNVAMIMQVHDDAAKRRREGLQTAASHSI